ncbi:MAG: hypothetical protein HY699_24655 [Deltaproteobacteria bacterium]|nr:hypothetical protein [Deltaproteobacteria bacterium]
MNAAAGEHWQAVLKHALAGHDARILARVPKTDLHCHGLLSAPLSVYERLLGHPLPPPPAAFADFSAFISYITANLLPALTGRGAVQAVMRAAFDRLADEGVVYAEMSFDLLVPDLIGVEVEEFAAVLAAEIERVAGRITIAPEVGINRKLPADAAEPRLRAWIATGVCRGIDLYDDESYGEVEDFVPLYRLAEARGLKLKAHAGELCGPKRVRESVEKLNLHAVQHGVRAAESPEVTQLLAERGTLLHLCPTSNVALGVCDTLENHPARQLFAQGVKITVNSDDFTLFGVGVCDELLNLSRMGFSPDEIVQIVENGLGEQPPKA